MRAEEYRRLAIYILKKPFLKIIYGKRLIMGSHGKMNTSSSIRIVNEDSKIQIGDRLNIRPNTELFAVREGKLIIGNNVFVNRGTIIGAAKGIVVGNNVTIGPNTCIYDHDHSKVFGEDFVSSEIVIDDGVWIGSGVCILKGVHIGANAIIAAGTVLTKDVEPNTLVCQKRETSTIKYE